jgi:hypothetical protein
MLELIMAPSAALSVARVGAGGDHAADYEAQMLRIPYGQISAHEP